MARAKRHYSLGHGWHITHRCQEQEFLLKFGRDQRRWVQWLFEAKKHYGLCILNYMATSNHIHLLACMRFRLRKLRATGQRRIRALPVKKCDTMWVTEESEWNRDLSGMN
jgi:REP element-mobilizing transposase RayT